MNGGHVWRQHIAHDLIEFQSNLVLDRFRFICFLLVVSEK